MSSDIFIVGGPTASGKSAFALELAERVNGEIVNGDSMQMYSHLHVLTARPTDTRGISHHLYGVLKENQVSSVGWWYEAASKIIQEIINRGKTPIIVGGTGLYLHALTHGISPIPEIPSSIRQKARHLSQTLSEEDFYDLVCREDPKTKGVFHQNDTQRLTRALEVVRTTGSSLLDYQGKTKKLLDLSYEYFVLLPPREVLYQRINDRFVWMIKNGALKEVEDLLIQNIEASSPILKAVGVPEITAYLKGDLLLDQAINLGQQSSRRYAKRQITWFTHQVPEGKIINDNFNFKL